MYAELSITSNFTFLTGASHPEEYAIWAKERGLEAIGIADRNTFAGLVRAHVAAKEVGIRFLPGVRLAFSCGMEVIAYPKDRPAYGRLCRLLTLGKRRTVKGQCEIFPGDLEKHGFGKGSVLIADSNSRLDLEALIRWKKRFGEDIFLGLAPLYDGEDVRRFDHIRQLAEELGLSLVATGNVLMHRAKRRALADILSCIREKTSIDKLGLKALPNAERRLKTPFEMRRLYTDYPEALTRTSEIVSACTFSLDELRYEYPEEVSEGQDPNERLRTLTEEGLKTRYPDGVPLKVQAMVEKELGLIRQMDYARYFLTVQDVVRYARSQDILCQGRGSAANSVVCYALGVTSVSPELITMVFERFVSEARNEPPDIDVDFEHERREEVIQHIYKKYGRHRAGLCATVIHFRLRAAIREVGKALGLSADAINALSSQIWGWSETGIADERIDAAGLDRTDKRIKLLGFLVTELVGFPRHLSQHVGGFVITKGRLDELCPIENAAMEDRTVIEWDKDDIDALGILKVDVLALGMLTCIAKSFQLLADWKDEHYELATLPPEDPKVYDMLCEGDTIGLFQVESRAQMNFLPRMRPREFHDLIVEVAIVRPGPIQGDMVHPYLKRRRGEEQVSYPSKELEAVLKRTLGVPLFQEQVMQIAVVAAGFTPSEADQLRRSVGTFRGAGDVSKFRERFISGAVERGYDHDYAVKCFEMLEGFSGYGFPESHSASFALLVYASAWLKRHHPEIFACALLNSQPMGFYAPAQIVADAKRHGVIVLPLDIQKSTWDHALEPDGHGRLALRLGFRQLKGFKEADAYAITAARGAGFTSIKELWTRTGVAPAALTRLAEADAFAPFGLDRRQALWQAQAIKGEAPPLLARLEAEERMEKAPLPAPTKSEEVFEDYVSTRLTLREHPAALLAAPLGGQRRLRAKLQRDTPNRTRAMVAGLVTTRQRPGTASGVIFLTLEDETGSLNVIVWPKTFEKHRREVMTGRLLKIHGEVQREGIVTHVIANRIEDCSHLLETLGDADAYGASIDPTWESADEAKRPGPNNVKQPPRTQAKPLPPRPTVAHPREQAKRLFSSRDFH
ncbi:error-prone DNA polymerase [Parvularcula sp. ZS-1/3]|uniref:Error-prone DNA polymerase n=1 Tax=Parvularcula mediterranea TaxID=2732508 RepID=A0A7Y3W517_9PROT|nr:error-prone DNA polymerase [Parvularcula mediterranea]NNU16058.1 error-prone DNA polymerase [Parvularcula mediterranea]